MSLSPLERRFWHYIGLTTPPAGIDGPCWIWTGSRNESGVPQWWQAGARRFPHVWAWERKNGPKPPGWQLSPRCERSACCQPAHRELRPRGQHRTPPKEQQ